MTGAHSGLTKWSQDRSYLIDTGRVTVGNESYQYLGFIYWDQNKATLISRGATTNGMSSMGMVNIAEDGTSFTSQFQFVDQWGRQAHGVQTARMINADTISILTREFVAGQEIVSTGSSRRIITAGGTTSRLDRLNGQAAGDGPQNSVSDLGCSLDSLKATDENVHSTLAVLDFDVGEHLGVDVGKAMADLCRDLLQRKRLFVLLDRERIAAVLGEQDFVAAVHCDNSKCLVEYGRLLGAARIMHGRINKLGNLLVLTIAMTDVNTGVQSSRSKMLNEIDEAVPALPILICEIVGDTIRKE